MSDILFSVRNLSTAFRYERKLSTVIDNLSFEIHKGEIIGIVGESGSGKSVTAKSMMRLIPQDSGKIIGGEVLLYGEEDVLKYGKRQLLAFRGSKVSMIFQEPMTSLNPVFTIGEQIMESVRLHQRLGKKAARAKAIEMLGLVGIPSPGTRVDSYPHELSGGMRQRAMIAMALSCNPELLIADEPTTALDPTIQAQILELILELKKKTGMAVMYITHDMGVVAETCQRVMVMYAGRIVEIAGVVDLFTSPAHPYTQGLMQAMPKIDEKRDRLYNIEGSVPHFSQLPPGCAFMERCPFRMGICSQNKPQLTPTGPGRSVSCWRAIQGTGK